jgi:hypothetical protein
MSREEKEMELRIRARSIGESPRHYDPAYNLFQFCSEAHLDRSWLMAALDREREKLTRIKQAAMAHKEAKDKLIGSPYTMETRLAFEGAERNFWRIMREELGYE